ncbi:hypothetical protein WR25_14280 isoform A [Diploscapter pachys]|uniref:WAPL domain-containing protein n=1 Tax=Diploscapter pachys TaxID=2018661 RepID=A0A2A2LVJ6_9BILA|nr:hypothetical protein WR25_14280 isoform A [Diploscapter pachys]
MDTTGEDDLFSKPVVRKRYERTKAVEVATAAEEALPSGMKLDNQFSTSSISDDGAIVQHDSPKQVFSPPLSLPESTSSADGNLDQDAALSSGSSDEGGVTAQSPENEAMDTETVAPEQHDSQSSTSSLNRYLASSSISTSSTTVRAKIKKPYASLAKPTDAPSSSNAADVYDIDNEIEKDDPQPKKNKCEPSNLMKEIRETRSKMQSGQPTVVYKHVWHLDVDDDDEEDEEGGNRKKRDDQSGTISQPYVRQAHSAGGQNSRVPVYRQSQNQADNLTGPSRKVKDAAEILEMGEQNDFKDDINYILTTLVSPKSSLNIKALCVASLARKCISPTFRRFLRTEQKINDVYKAVSDASQNQCYALATSCALYLMCRDPITLRFDISHFKLFAQLLAIETMERGQEQDRCKSTVWAIMQDFVAKNETDTRKIVLPFTKDTLSPSALTLCALSFVMAIRHTDNKLKTEMVNTGILQWLCTKIDKTMNHVLDKEKKEDLSFNLNHLERCFGIVEMGVMVHKKNQAFLISHRGNLILQLCNKFMTATLEKMASLDTDSSHFQSFVRTMQRMIRVLINLSYESELCSFKLGEIKGFLKSCLAAFTYYSPKYAPETSRFDLTVLLASLLVNLVERCNANRVKMIELSVKSIDPDTREEGDSRALEILTKYFAYYEKKARSGDESLDNELAFEEPDHRDNESGEDSDKEEGNDEANEDAIDDVTASGRLNRAK